MEPTSGGSETVAFAIGRYSGCGVKSSLLSLLEHAMKVMLAIMMQNTLECWKAA
jgi:hypothetical protein